MPTALVIGNSDGIGLALTRALLDRGWQVVGISRSASRIETPAYEHHVVDVCDVEYSGTLAAILLRSAEGPRALDVCVYCVGIGEYLDLETLASERRVFETNLLGMVTTVALVIPAMIRAGRGHFIGLSSQADALIGHVAPSYAASKAGMTSYLEGIGLACRRRGVHVTNVRFGFVDTKMAKAKARPFMLTPEQAAQRILRCLETKPLRDSYPRRMAALLALVRLRQSFLRCWL